MKVTDLNGQNWFLDIESTVPFLYRAMFGAYTN